MPQKKCPKCGESMEHWCWDIACEQLATVEDLTGYSCFNCQTTLIDLDDTTLAGFLYKAQLTWLNEGG